MRAKLKFTQTFIFKLYVIVNNGNLRLLVSTGDDTLHSIDIDSKRSIRVPSCEYARREMFFAYSDYIIYAGLSPVAPKFGIKLEISLKSRIIFMKMQKSILISIE